MNKIIKVDRVHNINEALRLQSLGVDIIGVSVCHSHLYSENRTIDLESISHINNILNQTKLAVEVSYNYSELLKLVDSISPSFIQVSGNKLLTMKNVRILKQRGIGIIYKDIEVSYDDDPSWILSGYLDQEEGKASYYQVDLLGDVENSWGFLELESPYYPEELQISDIVSLGRDNPLIITLDFSRNNISKIVSSFPSIKGIALTLSEKLEQKDSHTFKYQSVLNLLETIKE